MTGVRPGSQESLDAERTMTGSPMMPLRVFPELSKVLPRDCMVTIDAAPS